MKEYCDIINDIENRFDVWKWSVCGLHYWPLIRHLIWAELFKEQSQSTISGGVNTSKQEEAKSTLKSRLSWGFIQKIHASACASKFEEMSQEDGFRMRAKLTVSKYDFDWRNCDALVLSRLQDTNEYVDGRYHDRISDPIVRLLKKMGLKANKLIVTAAVPEEKRPLAVYGRLFVPDAYGAESFPVEPLTHLQRVNEVLSKFEASLVEPMCRAMIIRTINRAKAFGAVLDYHQPKVVFLGCYYDFLHSACVLAARQREIPVVDVQHGKQGQHHGAYSKWVDLPKNGHDLIPDVFWTWGEPTRDRINQAFSASKDTHNALSIGNTWLAEWKAKKHGRSRHISTFLSSNSSFKKRILVSLQPIVDCFPNVLREAISQAPDDWVWWFRLHPKQRNQASEVVKILEATGKPFEVGQTTDLPLYPLVMAAEHHLTAFSSVAFEAEALETPTTLFHDLGRQILSQEINEGRFFHATTSDEILKEISFPRCSADLPIYIESDGRKIERLLSELFK